MSLALSRPIALALLLFGAGSAGLLAPAAGASECPSAEFGTIEHIQASGPLTETTTATELVHQVAETADRDASAVTYRTNGLDAFVYDIGCVANEKSLQYRVADRTPTEFQDADYALAFYTEDFRKIGDTVYDKQAEDAHGQLAGYVPDHTAHIVVILEDGPLFAGMDHDRFPPEPYAATFELTLTANH